MNRSRRHWRHVDRAYEDPVRMAISRLWWPGFLETGSADVAADLAEEGWDSVMSHVRGWESWMVDDWRAELEEIWAQEERDNGRKG